MGGKVNHNVQLAYAFTFFSNATRGVWSFGVLSGYLYQLTDSNYRVGLAEGIQGVAQALLAVVAGIQTDSRGAQFVLRISGFCGLLAVASTFFAVLVGGPFEEYRYELMCGSLCLWGVYQGLWYTSLETIFADSTKTGERSKLNTNKFILTLVSGISGPALAAVIFLIGQDSWSLKALQHVLLLGAGLCAPPAMLLFLFRDSHKLGRASDSFILAKEGSPATIPNADDSDVTISRTQYMILWIMIAGDMVSGIGSGMTVKFFPLFFKNKVLLSPFQVNGIYVCSPLVMALGSYLAQRLSQVIGRLQTVFLYCLGGAAALGSISILGQHYDWTVWQVYVPVYLMSTAQHCCRPLKKSVLMDYAPRHTRARWNSLDSITRFGWSGSAILGGYLVDKTDYPFTFLITAILQAISACMYASIIPVVPQETFISDPANSLQIDSEAPLLQNVATGETALLPCLVQHGSSTSTINLLSDPPSLEPGSLDGRFSIRLPLEAKHSREWPVPQ